MRRDRIVWILSFLLLTLSQPLFAQKYRIESFKVLTNDVTAFVDPVTDLNDDACALIKILASPDFEFSTPLGIVKRVDKTGEIWLYIPKGSKKITLKHPQWGVLRDYVFPEKIESHISYELRVDQPPTPVSKVAESSVVTTVHDTLVMTHTDTLLLSAPKKIIPFSLMTEATVIYGGNSKTFAPGIMLAFLKRHGGFIHISSDFSRLGPVAGICDKKGERSGIIPYYSGETKHSFSILTAGHISALSEKIYIFEGIGYGKDETGWRLSESEGASLVRNNGLSVSGIAFEAGITYNIRRLSVSGSILSIQGKQWYGGIGVGLRFGKFGRHE